MKLKMFILLVFFVATTAITASSIVINESEDDKVVAVIIEEISKPNGVRKESGQNPDLKVPEQEPTFIDDDPNLVVSNEGLIPKLEVSIEEISGVQQVTLEYSIHNNSDERKKVEFPSSQQYDYILKSEDGTFETQFSQGYMFNQAMLTQVLPPKETFRYIADFGGLKPGKYTAEFWFTAKDYEPFKQSVTFEIKE